MSPADRLPSLPRESAVVVAVVSGSHVVNHMYLVLLPPIVGLLSVEFGLTVGTIGLAMGAVGLTNTTLQLPFGYLADTRSRTLALVASLAIGAVGAAITAFAQGFWWLVAGQLVIGVGVAAHHPAHYPLLADATPEHARGRAFSVHGFAGSLGFAAPPAIVAAVVGVPGLTWRHAVGLVAAVGAVYAVVAVLALRFGVPASVRRPPPRPEGTGRPLASRVRERLVDIGRSRVVLALALLALVTSVASWGLTSFAVVLLTDAYGVGVGAANLALTAMFVAGALAMLVGGSLTDRIAAGPVIVTAYAAVTVLLVVLAALVLSPLLAVVAVVLAGAVRATSGPARSKLADDASARDMVGQNFAVITIGIMLGGAIAPPLFGAIIDASGTQTAFFAIAAIAAVATGLTVVIVRAVEGGVVRPTAAPGDD